MPATESNASSTCSLPNSPAGDSNRHPTPAKPPLSKRLLKSAIRIALALALTTLLMFIVVAQPILPVDRHETIHASPDNLKADVLSICSNFYPRHCFNLPNLNACADLISARFRGTSATVTTQEYTIYGDTYLNISALFGDTNASRIVVVAHYDVCENTPGADDNASGVAGLMELARLLNSAAISNAVELVAVCTEEPPFFRTDDMGSFQHALSLKKQGVSVKAAISLEMIGYFSDAPFSQKYPFPLLYFMYPNRANFISVAADFSNINLTRSIKRSMRAATDLPVHSINAPRALPGIDLSDHRSYWAQGMPAVMVTDSAFYRNRRYHQMTDTPDSLDYLRMAEVVSAVNYAVLALDRE